MRERGREKETGGDRDRGSESENVNVSSCLIVSNFSECLCVRMFVRVSVMLAGRTNIS